MSAAPVRLAVCGLGSMGMRHLEIFTGLAPWAEIAAVADSHRPFVERAAGGMADVAVFEDPIECVRTADVDAVVVASADETHYGIVDACLARGLDVFCEKPLTVSTRQALQLVAAERVAGRRLVQVGFMRRYDANYRYLYDTVRSGRVGEPVLITQRHYNPSAVNNFDARQLVNSSAAHDIDLFRWLTGDEIRSVHCLVKEGGSGATLTVVVTLTSQSGVLGVLQLGRGPGMQYDIGLELVADRGSLTLGSPSLVTQAVAGAMAAQRLPDTWMERFDAAYRAQDAAWLRGVATRSVDGPTSYDGYATSAVVEAALTSLHTGDTAAVTQLRPGEI
ncbi:MULTISPECIES: Gfo/Idh/MocA family oxidoreductase [Mycobacterium]|uniref:Inositol 2-dehydrogenase n=1 Tax=Mycobacterium kiyosense TaxID=2871094 RepID=A0A9P3QBL2_9MYCO|nr:MULTISPECIES: Gfo/Idh/MocA family oxidoreductase [Mycobacterium]BDB40055.1 inositol 2-dehydrogenase [Mycobacterium kiyosense]BDE11893.1 inositol 2-dehydrogenase [Mycobacterium sp. 20KCMC460]GLB86984.1 inositol 2-dehydrogenase [Mycobacterium kiyosense]GLB91888.1 inositol 2-dehydrogenase [Mycobacterium kiyosense]GLB97906.1 inositol 2-dehydrogenase [Mycobacterium kiyosense]